MFETLETIGSNPVVMKWAGAIVLALLGFGFMRFRRHPMNQSLAFGGGIIGIIIILSAIKYLFF